MSSSYTPGDFSFIECKSTQDMLKDGFQAVTITESWAIMAEDPGNGGFMYTSNQNYEPINKAIKYDGHSGTSYGWMMRVMQRIAQIGWDAYVKERLSL